MKEKFTVIAAGAGLLVGCSAGPEDLPAQPNDLVVAHEVALRYGESRIPLEVGARVVGICIYFNSQESAVLRDSGLIRVQHGEMIGATQTRTKAGSDTIVDTFQGMTEADLDKTYPRCDEHDKAQKERDKNASIL